MDDVFFNTSKFLMELGQPHVTNQKIDHKVANPFEGIGILKGIFPSIDNAVLNNQAPRNRPLNANLGL